MFNMHSLMCIHRYLNWSKLFAHTFYKGLSCTTYEMFCLLNLCFFFLLDILTALSTCRTCIFRFICTQHCWLYRLGASVTFIITFWCSDHWILSWSHNVEMLTLAFQTGIFMSFTVKASFLSLPSLVGGGNAYRLYLYSLGRSGSEAWRWHCSIRHSCPA